jgi:hypothetical protein
MSSVAAACLLSDAFLRVFKGRVILNVYKSESQILIMCRHTILIILGAKEVHLFLHNFLRRFSIFLKQE